MPMPERALEGIEAGPGKGKRSHRYVTIYLTEGDLILLKATMEHLGTSRSATMRNAIHAYAGIVAKLVR